MNGGRRRRRVDRSVATTFVLFWLICCLGLLMVPSAWTTGHGNWQRTESWHQGSGEPVPEWFPVPVFDATSVERREYRGWAGTSTPVFVMAGATTYAEYAASGETLRVSVPSGEIVEIRREDVAAFPPRYNETSLSTIEFPESVLWPDRRERFPWRIEGALSYEGHLDLPRHVMSINAFYEKGVRSVAYLVRTQQGEIVPGSARLYLPGLSRRAIFMMTLSGLLAAIPAVGLTYAAAYASSKAFRLFG